MNKYPGIKIKAPDPVVKDLICNTLTNKLWQKLIKAIKFLEKYTEESNISERQSLSSTGKRNYKNFKLQKLFLIP